MSKLTDRIEALDRVSYWSGAMLTDHEEDTITDLLEELKTQHYNKTRIQRYVANDIRERLIRKLSPKPPSPAS